MALGAASLTVLDRTALANGGAPVAATTPSGGTAATPALAAPTGPFTLPALGYAFDALEPHLDAQTMQLHHDKHHAAYVANLNKAVAGRKEVVGWSLDQLVRDLAKVPDEIRTAVRNHGGGHANHSLLWTTLKRDGAKAPAGELAGAIDKAFGSLSGFQDKFNAAATGVFGSGWAWLAHSKADGLTVMALPNQDSPMSTGWTPLFGIDVWEHAYYLKFQNRRAEYITAFQSVVDWDAVSARYRDALKG
ncbi:MAG: superoxide dismutase [Candidatus Eisenbacteria bacterium]|uniref:Superoxide dismutase n=1 Tax=Eiseniibacteriota bacterium TaxID=2212470 RepID=A0A849SHX3_UNCEI|nr:superoxide dismutase [Candidatus Eisenbacteria bacterium]